LKFFLEEKSQSCLIVLDRKKDRETGRVICRIIWKKDLASRQRDKKNSTDYWSEKICHNIELRQTGAQ